MKRYDVWIQKIKDAVYPDFPYDPPKGYPELLGLDYMMQYNSNNEIYTAVREILYQMGFDRENYGTAMWNPLRGVVGEGNTVLIKPNFVRGTHIWGEQGVQAMITNLSVIRPIIDYVLLASQGNVRIIVGDAPMRGSDWDAIVKHSNVQRLINFYRNKGYQIELIDFRKDLTINNKEQVYEKTVANPSRTPQDYVEIDIGHDSMLDEIIDSNYNFEMGGVKRGTISRYHNERHNTYLFPREALEADVFINVPKLKTHRMAGLTCAMKNLIGINGEKERIAHYRRGVKNQKSDEFEKFYLKIYLRERIWTFLKAIEQPWSRQIMTWGKKFVQKYIWHGKTFEETYALNPPKEYREGGWKGNDTLWRCAMDINRILLYADREGKMHDKPQRQYLCVVDAVIAGEGEGPLANTPKKAGVVMGGLNPVMVDYAAAQLMCFDYRMLPMIKRAFEPHKFPLINRKPKEVQIGSNVAEDEYCTDFVPTSGWSALFQSRKNNKLE